MTSQTRKIGVLAPARAIHYIGAQPRSFASKQSITAPLSLSETAGVSLDLCADLEEIRLFLSAAGQMQFVWTRVTGPKELTLPLFDFSAAPRPFPKPSPGLEL